jgi:hypothetical protein
VICRAGRPHWARFARAFASAALSEVTMPEAGEAADAGDAAAAAVLPAVDPPPAPPAEPVPHAVTARHAAAAAAASMDDAFVLRSALLSRGLLRTVRGFEGMAVSLVLVQV